MSARGQSKTVTVSLPNGANTVTGAITDLTNFILFLGNLNSYGGNFSQSLSIPALTTSELPNGKTMTYVVQGSNDADFKGSYESALYTIVQTGAGGAGAGAQVVNPGLPPKKYRYVRIVVTNSGTGNPSAKSATLTLTW